MASHGRRGITRLILGSQANQVVTHSSIPVLICR
jgi:nucleotide-binding universal stress UspA family protein